MFTEETEGPGPPWWETVFSKNSDKSCGARAGRAGEKARRLSGCQTMGLGSRQH